MRTIFYLDNINFSSIWSYFFQNKTKNLIVLDHIKLNVFTSFFIKITNLTIKEADFIAGYLLDLPNKL